jgi:hypothetical protein
MGILIIREKVTPEQLRNLLEYQGFLAGGGDAHADCEAMMLELGCEQRNRWGSGWNWKRQEVKFDSLINIRPRDGNRQHELQDPNLRERVRQIIAGFFEGVQP